MSKVFRTFTTRDLIVIAGLAGIGLAIKPLISPLSKMITSPLMIPGGSFTGGLYMLWMVLAVLIVDKFGTGIVYGLLQALVIMVIGIRGNQGLLSLVSYTFPGLLVDLVYLAIPHPERIWGQMLLCALANMAGALIVAIFVFHHPLPFILIIEGMSMVSGIIGGWISWTIYKTIIYYELVQ